MVHFPFKDIKCSKLRQWLSFHFKLTATLCAISSHTELQDYKLEKKFGNTEKHVVEGFLNHFSVG